ncbi:TPA: hypothetical protein KOU07_000733 [Clostridioides difficile]|nr:hypothetical protein [Clostridioides difficile]MCJ0360463.1 hypothetical protein [Clostridioides difficile]MCJ0385356.1 hypothetical protein [Clostridioides difficile]MCJ0394928.1 hypothetical protein [Clostridioides difficile]HBF4202521.1 hypothetical protein [Clostridioides difficile]
MHAPLYIVNFSGSCSSVQAVYRTYVLGCGVLSSATVFSHGSCCTSLQHRSAPIYNCFLA